MKKDPDATLDYAFDWTDWLDGDVILSHVITTPTGLTNVADTESNGIVQVILSGGTQGVTYQVSCKISTATLTDERTMLIRCEER